MKNLVYRNLETKDFESIQNLICETFNFNNFISNKTILKEVLRLYFEESLMESSFAQVVTNNQGVIGFIFAKAKNDFTNYSQLLNIDANQKTKIDFSSLTQQDIDEITEFIKIKETYFDHLTHNSNNFQGNINLFAVSKEARGIGIGKNLLKNTFEYMKNQSVSSLYLFTDTRCNYGFYDVQSFERLSEKNVYIKTISSDINTFLYSYTF